MKKDAVRTATWPPAGITIPAAIGSAVPSAAGSASPAHAAETPAERTALPSHPPRCPPPRGMAGRLFCSLPEVCLPELYILHTCAVYFCNLFLAGVVSPVSETGLVKTSRFRAFSPGPGRRGIFCTVSNAEPISPQSRQRHFGKWVRASSHGHSEATHYGGVRPGTVVPTSTPEPPRTCGVDFRLQNGVSATRLHVSMLLPSRPFSSWEPKYLPIHNSSVLSVLSVLSVPSVVNPVPGSSLPICWHTLPLRAMVPCIA